MERSPAHNLGDEELVARAQEGEREAFEVLVERYKVKAYHIAFDYIRDREEAKDLSQEAFLRAFSHLRTFDMRSSFYTWFYRILVNLCVDYCRHRRRVNWVPLGDPEKRLENQDGTDASSPGALALAEETSRKLGAALDMLPPRQRTAFLLRNHEGLSIREIAQVMKTREGTVKAQLHRSIITLRQNLAGLLNAHRLQATHTRRLVSA